MHIVECLWQMSLLASLLIGFVLVLRLLLRRCSKGYSYGLWLLVLLRLLCPVFVESDYSVQPRFLTDETAWNAPRAGEQSSDAHISTGADEFLDKKDENGTWSWGENSKDAAAPEHVETQASHHEYGQAASYKEEKESRPVLWSEVCRGVYVLGAGALLLWFAAQYIGWKRRLKAAVHLRDNIWCSERVASPFVLGVLHPRIYLPYGLDNQEENYILLHEQSHIQHRDPLLRLLGTFALCLHWWNPLVWLGIHMFYQDMEMFCDETAMTQADSSQRQAYAATLLQFAIRQSGPAAVLAFGETHTERRVRNILERKKQGKAIALLVVLAASVGGIVFLTVPRETQEQQPSASSQNAQQEEQRDLIFSQGQVETSAGDTVTVQLVLTEGTRIAYQNAEGGNGEYYEGVYELQTLDAQGQLLDRKGLLNEQGGERMRFYHRDFPWYFEDYNLDGQQDFFLGTQAADWGNYRYLFTVTAEGELRYLYDGPMGESWIMDADFITNAHLESGGVETDNRVFLLYQLNQEYSSHDFYTWYPELGAYRKRVEFTGVYPEGWDQGALDYLEGDWRVAETALWNHEGEKPTYCVGETLSYTDGAFRRTNAAGVMVYESNVEGCSILGQSAEEFLNTYNAAWPGAYTERILLNLGEECDLGNVVYKLDDHTILVYELGTGGTFWTAVWVEAQ